MHASFLLIPSNEADTHKFCYFPPQGRLPIEGFANWDYSIAVVKKTEDEQRKGDVLMKVSEEYQLTFLEP